MNEQASHDRSSDVNALETRLDGMLTEFFRNETPAGLGQGSLNWDEVDRRTKRATQPALVTVAPSADPELRSPQRRLATLISVLSLAACMAVVIYSQRPDTNTASPIADDTPVITEPGDSSDLMLVSPRSDHPDNAAVVGDHGLTIEETDGVDLSPTKP